MAFIHTTHVGSLPRSAKLAAMLLERDHGVEVPEATFDALVQAEIEDAVRAQVEAVQLRLHEAFERWEKLEIEYRRAMEKRREQLGMPSGGPR